MYSQSFIVLLTLLAESTVSASPVHGNIYRRASKADGDVRSPCPALNALANHGHLPRNGKSITANQLQTSIQEVYNIDTTVGYLISHAAIPLVENNTLTATTLDLDHLNLHDAIEHDASLTRNDFRDGDNHSKQAALIDALLADAQGDYLTLESIAKTRARRERDSQAKGSPKLTTKGLTLAYGEASLLLQAFSPDPSGTPQASKAAVGTWLREEKLDGYVKPVKAITTSSILTMSTKLQNMVKQVSSTPATASRYGDSYKGMLTEWLGY